METCCAAATAASSIPRSSTTTSARSSRWPRWAGFATRAGRSTAVYSEAGSRRDKPDSSAVPFSVLFLALNPATAPHHGQRHACQQDDEDRHSDDDRQRLPAADAGALRALLRAGRVPAGETSQRGCPRSYVERRCRACAADLLPRPITLVLIDVTRRRQLIRELQRDQHILARRELRAAGNAVDIGGKVGAARIGKLGRGLDVECHR